MRQRNETLAGPQLTELAKEKVACPHGQERYDRPSDEAQHAAEQRRFFKSEHCEDVDVATV